MKEFWNMIQMVFTMVDGWLGYFLGGCDDRENLIAPHKMKIQVNFCLYENCKMLI